MKLRAIKEKSKTAKPSTDNSPEWSACASDAAYFTDEYVQIDEPQGGDLTVVPFKLWPEQAVALLRMATERLLIILKARQLGITWLCCAYALWLCIFKPGQVVLLFSKGAIEAYELARRIRVMYFRLPLWMRERNPLVKDNLSELTWANGSRVQSLAATRSAGRSFTASLVLMDEAAFMQWADELYTALKPTIDGGGQLFVVSTANGEGGLFHKLWADAVKGLNNFATLFLSWRARPGRDDAWRARVAAEALSSVMDLQEYPGTAEEAFQATGNERFLSSMLLWDACREELPPLTKHEPLILALDGAYAAKGDVFGGVAVGRHPTRPDSLAVREVMAWEAEGEPRDFEQIQDDIKNFCLTWNVRKIVYDPMQLVQMMQHLSKASKTESGLNFPGVQTEEFKQGVDRAAADKQLLDSIASRYIAHSGDARLRKHLDNADKKVDENKKLRIVKRTESQKIDLAVCLSMAAHRAADLPVEISGYGLLQGSVKVNLGSK